MQDTKTDHTLVNVILDRSGSMRSVADDTIGGFIFGMLGHVPVQGESVDFDGWRISTETLDGRRIQQVRISAITP